MRRSLLAACTALALLATGAALAPAAMADGPVAPVQFGMHVPDIAKGVDPNVDIGSIRLWDSGVAWGQVQQKKNTFWWTGLDKAISNSYASGSGVLYVLGSTPTWAASNKKQGSYPYKGAASVPNMKDWKAWVTQVATRYRGSIAAYQIWNEANLTNFWAGNPKQMAKLTSEAYKIIKRIDPNAKVVSASSTVRLSSAYNRFFPAYLKELGKLGWPVDAIAVHTYPDGQGTPATRAGYLQQVNSQMRASGVPASKELWDTEVNYGIAGPGGVPGQRIGGADAAAWVAQTYLDNLRFGVDRAYWYYWYPQNSFLGIILDNGTTGAKGYQTVFDWLNGAYYTCTSGTVNVCQFGDYASPRTAVWASSGSGTYTVPANATIRCDALGACAAAVPGTTETIGSMPIWYGTFIPGS